MSFDNTFIGALIGGGIGAAAVTALFDIWASKTQVNITLLQDQLRELYGPLYFLTRQNQALFDLCNKYHEAYDKTFSGKKYADEAFPRVQQEMQAMIEDANQYIKQVELNDQKALDLLEKSWHHADPDDIDIFIEFQIDYSRLILGRKESFATVIATHQHIGNISYMRPSMIERVESKWTTKKAELVKLSRWSLPFGKKLNSK